MAKDERMPRAAADDSSDEDMEEDVAGASTTASSAGGDDQSSVDTDAQMTEEEAVDSDAESANGQGSDETGVAEEEELRDTADSANSVDKSTNARVSANNRALGNGVNSLDNTNPLLEGVGPATKSFDRQVAYWADSRTVNYLYFDQWKNKVVNRETTVTRLRLTLEELLPRLLGARDYAGAAKVLEVMYHRFAVTPALCVEASLEIIRRQPDYRNDLLNFYEAALKARRIDKMSILKEMWFFHIIHGEFYEAYHMYLDKIQHMKEAEDDARLLANFGILCYWLMFIESKELRERLKREDTGDDEEDDMDTATGNGFGTCESIESVIESNYLFKSPVGVHILYQHSNSALRRAVALSPNSAMFVEHYVQLLVLVGDIQPACDYLEAFFHLNPHDPHGPRMLAGFLECYYPDSVDAQVAAFSRWMKNDPSCSYPLEKMLELSSAGAVSSFLLTTVLVEALDTCGSDLYLVEHPEIALTLWRNLAELLAAMDEDEFLLDQVEGGESDSLHQKTIADVGAQRLWWKRVYFARPRAVEEIVALSQRDNTFMEASIYRAAVADRLFPGHIPMSEALCSAMSSSNQIFNREHIRLFKSFFPSSLNTTAEVVTRTSFDDMAFIHVTVAADKDGPTKRPLPVFKGSSDTFHVIDRKSIVEKEAKGEKAELEITGTGETDEVDPQLVEELYEALESEVGYSTGCNLRSRRKRKAGAISSTTAPVLIPAYVGMVEEEIYCNPDASLLHVYTMIHQKLRRSDMLVPTSNMVKHCMVFFQNRLRTNLTKYGHGGLMMRYEEFIATFVRRQRAKGVYEVTKDTVKTLIQAMKRVLPSPHPYFPSEKIVEEAMHAKTGIFDRQRRLRLMEMKKTLKIVIRKLVYVDEKIFVDAVDSVCKQNGLLGVITRFDIARALQNILPRHYYKVLDEIPPNVLRKLTSPSFRNGCSTAQDIYEKLGKARRTIGEIKALLWVERYEALYGPIYDEEDVGDSDTDFSDSDSSVSSVSVSSVSTSDSNNGDSDSGSEFSSDGDSDSGINELRASTKQNLKTENAGGMEEQESLSGVESGNESSVSVTSNSDDD
ncbi:Tetratricopeptide-like helical [Phytophthora cinnamomi]|uniref:Tetratricopeptide-like helical n=1 Tax=Phytophthora cinnamomi TaxID=4785 RepID=UPI00355A1C1B|nr:Tetratricopeptide-like helical [Phytophthora cinnamomi]